MTVSLIIWIVSANDFIFWPSDNFKICNIFSLEKSKRNIFNIEEPLLSEEHIDLSDIILYANATRRLQIPWQAQRLFISPCQFQVEVQYLLSAQLFYSAIVLCHLRLWFFRSEGWTSIKFCKKGVWFLLKNSTKPLCFMSTIWTAVVLAVSWILLRWALD